jgi:hypothetical protein
MEQENNNNSNNNNIFFVIEENENNETNVNNNNVENMIHYFLDESESESDSDSDKGFGFEFGFGFDQTKTKPINILSLPYFIEKNKYYGNDEIYYEEYTVKELMRICQYYNIAKNIKSAKCKKQDVISTIVFFEGQTENQEIVNKRHSMWAYMAELAADIKMKPYIIWP